MSIRAIILSGGRSNRFGGVHKPAVELGGVTVISRILGTVRTVDPLAEVWVAGPTDGLSQAETESVHAIREEPVFAGPLAGIAAACSAVRASESATGAGESADVTLVLAGDMPLITAGHLGELMAACRRAGLPATGTDDRGKTQFLCAAWPTALLLARVESIPDPVDGAVRLLFAGLEPTLVDVEPSVVADFDTAADLERIHARFDGGVRPDQP
ncbi:MULTISPECIES: molybdenum cofactor guanylyltransferase [Brevibacterium]|jgi:molybdenum cofactor guanylyltransferase|uniref:Molybdenum cofactor guanylyltransferase n=1 Tax=Brevibacterium aurantiacum TaxID=273384 RepID=A0A556CQN1_BREAU|nr:MULTISPECIES: molybdenum cofactor guanylyltransferase [Brevibacterium]MBM6589578.1 molybdenum cofactor guanylyltransferase [Brevibacterium sp. RIT 803]TSI19713.1 molybdenum cofactor guanylyltransferase [Brevibacterium aurantiacum]